MMKPEAKPKPVIGLLGGVGSGKSLVARQFAQLGCGVIDADELSRKVMDDPVVIARIMQRWGDRVRAADGSLDRQAVARIVFEAPRELRWLEELVHPRVHEGRAALYRRYQSDPGVKAIVEDCPLLLEKGIDRECAVLVLVDASRDNRLKRVAATRGWDSAELVRREKNQVPLDRKAVRADYVVDNNAGEAECFAHVRQVFAQILPDQA